MTKEKYFMLVDKVRRLRNQRDEMLRFEGDAMFIYDRSVIEAMEANRAKIDKEIETHEGFIKGYLKGYSREELMHLKAEYEAMYHHQM